MASGEQRQGIHNWQVLRSERVQRSQRKGIRLRAFGDVLGEEHAVFQRKLVMGGSMDCLDDGWCGMIHLREEGNGCCPGIEDLTFWCRAPMQQEERPDEIVRQAYPERGE